MIEQKRWRTNKEKCVVGSALHRWHDSPYFLLTSRWPVFSPRRYRFLLGGPDRVAILGKSHPAKNRNLSRLISNLSRLNWPSERNSVHWFSTVFNLETSSSHSTTPSIELVCNQSPLHCFYVNNRRHILHRHSGVTLYSPSAWRISGSFCSLFSICTLFPRL
jgi:hypothetical protein